MSWRLPRFSMYVITSSTLRYSSSGKSVSSEGSSSSNTAMYKAWRYLPKIYLNVYLAFCVLGTKIMKRYTRIIGFPCWSKNVKPLLTEHVADISMPYEYFSHFLQNEFSLETSHVALTCKTIEMRYALEVLIIIPNQ